MMKISMVISISDPAGQSFYKIFVYDDNQNKFGEFEFQNVSRANEFRSRLEIFVQQEQERRLKKLSGQK